MQLTLNQKCIIMLENNLVILVSTSYALLVFNCFALFIFYFVFETFFFKTFWTYSFDEEFWNDSLSTPINNQLWQARVRLFNNRLNKRSKATSPSYLSNDLSKRLTEIVSLHLRSIYQLCSFLLISVVFLCLYIKNVLLLKSGDIESNPEPLKCLAPQFFLY